MILDAAESLGQRSGANPARWATLKNLLPKANRAVVHHVALAYADLPALVAELGTRDTISHKDISRGKNWRGH